MSAIALPLPGRAFSVPFGTGTDTMPCGAEKTRPGRGTSSGLFAVEIDVGSADAVGVGSVAGDVGAWTPGLSVLSGNCVHADSATLTEAARTARNSRRSTRAL